MNTRKDFLSNRKMTPIRKGYTIIDLHGSLDEKVVCLTLDVEPDFAGLLDEPRYEGLSHIEALVDFLKERDVPLTCFVQGSLFETHQNELQKILPLDNIEFELHSYSHDETLKGNMAFEVKRGKEAFKKIIGKNPTGYRSPLGLIREGHYEILAANGFKFDSSVFPSVRLGAFSNLDKPTTPYLVGDTGIIEFPFAVFSNFFRVVVGLSYVKLLGKAYLNLLKASKLLDFIVFGFHLHDVFELDSSREIQLDKFSPLYRLIFNRLYVKQRKSGLALLDEIINVFHRKDYRFCKLDDIYKLLVER